jgi:dTDP-4-dehydrorhamnose 3,5-epimerase
VKVRRDKQTVEPDGTRLVDWIEGVKVRDAVNHPDERGELCEIFDPAWGFHEGPLVYVYQTMVRPGKVKGWVYHEHQDDRIFVSIGDLKIVLFDRRKGCATQGRINEIHLTERNRGLLIIPKGVLHAVQNVGSKDALFINMPTKPYAHKQPDKYRVPLDDPDIPYSFDSGPGW